MVFHLLKYELLLHIYLTKQNNTFIVEYKLGPVFYKETKLKYLQKLSTNILSDKDKPDKISQSRRILHIKHQFTRKNHHNNAYKEEADEHKDCHPVKYNKMEPASINPNYYNKEEIAYNKEPALFKAFAIATM